MRAARGWGGGNCDDVCRGQQRHSRQPSQATRRPLCQGAESRRHGHTCRLSHPGQCTPAPDSCCPYLRLPPFTTMSQAKKDGKRRRKQPSSPTPDPSNPTAEEEVPILHLEECEVVPQDSCGESSVSAVEDSDVDSVLSTQESLPLPLPPGRGKPPRNRATRRGPACC